MQKSFPNHFSELIKNKSVREFFEIIVNFFLADFFEGCRQWGKVKKWLENIQAHKRVGKFFSATVLRNRCFLSIFFKIYTVRFDKNRIFCRKNLKQKSIASRKNLLRIKNQNTYIFIILVFYLVFVTWVIGTYKAEKKANTFIKKVSSPSWNYNDHLLELDLYTCLQLTNYPFYCSWVEKIWAGKRTSDNSLFIGTKLPFHWKNQGPAGTQTPDLSVQKQLPTWCYLQANRKGTWILLGFNSKASSISCAKPTSQLQTLAFASVKFFSVFSIFGWSGEGITLPPLNWGLWVICDLCSMLDGTLPSPKIAKNKLHVDVNQGHNSG